MSLTASLAAMLVLASPAPRDFALLIGSNQGNSGDEPLQFAETGARTGAVWVSQHHQCGHVRSPPQRCA